MSALPAKKKRMADYAVVSRHISTNTAWRYRKKNIFIDKATKVL
jgi:hypothetical protein